MLVCGLSVTHMVHRLILEVRRLSVEPRGPSGEAVSDAQRRPSVSDQYREQLRQAAEQKAAAEQVAHEAIEWAKELRRHKEEAERRAVEAERRWTAATRKEPVDEAKHAAAPRGAAENLTLCYSLDSRQECVSPELQFTSPTRVHLVTPDSPSSGWRFQHLVKMGFASHPAVAATSSMAEADLVLYMPISTKEPPSAAAGATPTKLVVLDEGDGAGFYGKVKETDYLVYLKRSWVTKRDGVYTGTGRRYKRNYFPLAYSVSDSYFDPRKTADGRDRSLDVVCSNRPTSRQPTRARVVKWVNDFLDKHDAYRGIGGEVNAAGRREINGAYFAAMRSAKIVVTCNPSHWEGDFRTFEALASGALVFVDEMYVPHPRPFVDGVHVVVYDNSDQADFERKLLFYLEHPREARRIAAAGLRHALAHHRAVSRMDYVLRSAHELASPAASARYTHTAKQIAFDVNATTQVPPIVDIASPDVNVPHVDPARNLGRKFPTAPISDDAISDLVRRNQARRRHLGIGAGRSPKRPKADRVPPASA